MLRLKIRNTRNPFANPHKPGSPEAERHADDLAERIIRLSEPMTDAEISTANALMSQNLR